MKTNTQIPNGDDFFKLNGEPLEGAILKLTPESDLKPNTVYFSNQGKEMLKLCPNGDIFVHGKLAETDKEVVNVMREFLINQGFNIGNEESRTREQKLETIVKLFAKTMFYGDWKWETPNERVIEMLMREVELYPFPNEDAMIYSTKVDDNLYLEAKEKVKGRFESNINSI